jgi:tRNA nucleotidyltransferase/poly(A) polymerase
MNNVRQRVTVHEKTVQRAAKDQIKTPRKRTRKPSMVQPTFAAPLVDERVWAEAKKLLKGPHGYTRWDVLDSTTVVVR